MDKNTKITIAISVAVLTVFIITLSFMGGKDNSGKDADVTVATSTESTTTISSQKEVYVTGLPVASNIVANKTDGLSVVDQLAGEEVAFSGTTFIDDTWVAVYEDKNGEPSSLLGVGLFFGGITEGESPIMRKTVSGSKYYATLIKDNGDRVFNIEEDRPVSGAPVVSFMAK